MFALFKNNVSNKIFVLRIINYYFYILISSATCCSLLCVLLMRTTLRPIAANWHWIIFSQFKHFEMGDETVCLLYLFRICFANPFSRSTDNYKINITQWLDDIERYLKLATCPRTVFAWIDVVLQEGSQIHSVYGKANVVCQFHYHQHKCDPANPF